ncbi:MAG: hypothetical protein CME06_17045 [Gemmatimonadetes bacterium]|nr:hypothetical protein [Gemmatimonadota bacterium]
MVGEPTSAEPASESTESMKRIHIFGASGTGTTTLAGAFAAHSSCRHFDVDDYFWIRTDPPFRSIRGIEERRRLLSKEDGDGRSIDSLISAPAVRGAPPGSASPNAAPSMPQKAADLGAPLSASRHSRARGHIETSATLHKLVAYLRRLCAPQSNSRFDSVLSPPRAKGGCGPDPRREASG